MRTRTLLVALTTAFVGLVGCSGGDGGAGCTDQDLDRFMSEIDSLGITYDYDPSESPVHLRDMADLVVEGELVRLTESAEELVLAVDVAEVLKGDPNTKSDEIQFALGFNPTERDFGDIATGFAVGLRGVFFLVARPPGQPAPWSPLVEGLWFACERPTPQVAVLEPAWEVASLDELIDAISE